MIIDFIASQPHYRLYVPPKASGPTTHATATATRPLSPMQCLGLLSSFLMLGWSFHVIWLFLLVISWWIRFQVIISCFSIHARFSHKSCAFLISHMPLLEHFLLYFHDIAAHFLFILFDNDYFAGIHALIYIWYYSFWLDYFSIGIYCNFHYYAEDGW